MTFEKLTMVGIMDIAIIAFGVDDTLILWKEEDEPPDINWNMLNLLITLEQMPNTQIIVWSGGGRDYAEYWGKWLNLPVSIDYADKQPDLADVAFDDGGENREFNLATVNIIIKE